MRARLLARLWVMTLARIGALTGIAEALATAVGAGMLLGAFASGAISTVRGRSPVEVEEEAIGVSYIGGVLGAFLFLCDLVVGYAL